jgi:hypothetical protein
MSVNQNHLVFGFSLSSGILNIKIIMLWKLNVSVLMCGEGETYFVSLPTAEVSPPLHLKTEIQFLKGYSQSEPESPISEWNDQTLNDFTTWHSKQSRRIGNSFYFHCVLSNFKNPYKHLIQTTEV